MNSPARVQIATFRCRVAKRFCLASFASLLALSQPCPLAGQTAPPTALDAAKTHADWGPPVRDNQVLAHALFEQLEGRTAGSSRMLRWDAQGWIGTDMNRLWLKSEGFRGTQQMSDGDHEALYDRPIPRMRYFDGQIGIRGDLDSGPRRVWAAVGVEGLAPWFFEFAPTFYIRDGSNVAGRVETSWELNLIQRLVLEPQVEMNFYNKDDPPRKIGSGFSDLDGGLRLRYEVRRKFAPYLGFAYNGSFTRSAAYERQTGEATHNSSFVFGLRTWY